MVIQCILAYVTSLNMLEFSSCFNIISEVLQKLTTQQFRTQSFVNTDCGINIEHTFVSAFLSVKDNSFLFQYYQNFWTQVYLGMFKVFGI